MIKTTIKIILLLAAVLVGGWLTGQAIDGYYNNQDRMLCNSALVSGNEDYLVRCACFYEGHAIGCIYERTK